MPAPATQALSFEQVLERLGSAGFEVTQADGGRARAQHGNCACVLERGRSGETVFAERPGYLIGGHIARLEDRGFQKYLVTSERRVPALAEHLKQIHNFSERLKQALGLKSLYNESLGTVSDRYLYDRVEGREGPPKPHH